MKHQVLAPETASMHLSLNASNFYAFAAFDISTSSLPSPQLSACLKVCNGPFAVAEDHSFNG